MKVREFSVAGFRGFADERRFQLSDRFTVIAGINGRGKSSLLDGLALLLARLLRALALSAGSGRTISANDVHVGRSAATLAMQASCAGIPVKYDVAYPGSAAGEPTTADLRWLRRQEVWTLAHDCVARLANSNTIEVRELIVEVAIARGMFSIWWIAFAGNRDMRLRLRQAFQGTCVNSFDVNEDLQARAGGQL